MEEHKKDGNSALFKHSKETKHEIDYENFEVIDKASNDLKLKNLIKRYFIKENRSRL